MNQTAPNRLLNSTLLCNLELSLGESLLGTRAITIFSHIDLEKLFTDTDQVEDALQTLTIIAATIIEFQHEIQKNRTRERLIKLLGTPKYKKTIDQILGLQSGTITAINTISKTFLYPTVIIDDIEVPIIFLHTVNGKPISLKEI